MGSGCTLTFLDYDSEAGTVSVEGREVDDTSFDAVNLEITALRTAIEAVSIGTLRKEVRRMSTDFWAGTPPSDKQAQREKKWNVLYQDGTNFKNFSFEIPCADLTLLDATRRGYMDKTLAAYTNLKAAIEAWLRSPYGNAVTVNDLHYEGRDL